MSEVLALKGEAREVARAEAQAVHGDGARREMRERLAELVAAVDEGEVGGDSAELLESVLELGLQTGRIRAYYGPGGEQAALSTLRKLPRGRERADTARDVSAALRALAGAQLEAVRSRPSRPARSGWRSRQAGSRRRSGWTPPAPD